MFSLICVIATCCMFQSGIGPSINFIQAEIGEMREAKSVFIFDSTKYVNGMCSYFYASNLLGRKRSNPAYWKDSLALASKNRVSIGYIAHWLKFSNQR